MIKSQKQGQSATVKTDQFINTTNRFAPLTKVQTDNIDTILVIVNGEPLTKRNIKVNNRNASRRVCGKIGDKKQKKKIIVISDSHARGCAREISNYLGKEVDVSGTVMPGAGLAHIVNLAQEDISNLSPYDAVVIWGGSNNINKNETSRGLKHLLNFINHRRKIQTF